MDPIFLAAFGIGLATGLRAMTGLAVVAWAACSGWIDLQASPFAFMGSTWAVILFSIAALGEYVNDLLPRTPSRTRPGPLAARIVFGAVCGACVCLAGGSPAAAGAVLGGIGGVAGAFGGYHARVGLVRRLGVRDAFVAVPEDLVAIALALAGVALR